MMKSETASNEKDDFSFLQQIAERMYDIGSRISSGSTTPDDADFLRDSAAEIEKMVGKFGHQKEISLKKKTSKALLNILASDRRVWCARDCEIC